MVGTPSPGLSHLLGKKCVAVDMLDSFESAILQHQTHSVPAEKDHGNSARFCL